MLSATPSQQEGVLSELQRLFVLLRWGGRRHTGPGDFYAASRPPWFSPGQQQDCSEYLRHLLTAMHEQVSRTRGAILPASLICSSCALFL